MVLAAEVGPDAISPFTEDMVPCQPVWPSQLDRNLQTVGPRVLGRQEILRIGVVFCPSSKSNSLAEKGVFGIDCSGLTLAATSFYS